MSKKEYLSPEYGEIQEAIEAEIARGDEMGHFDNGTDFDPLPSEKAKVSGKEWNGGNWSRYGTRVYNGGYQASLKPICKHPPRLVIDQPGMQVSFGKKWDCEDHLSDFTVAVNLTGSSAKRKHDIPIPSLAKWATYSKCIEVVLDWPDFGVLPFPLEFWEDLTQAIRDNGGKGLVFCQGGHGRTGTAMACLLISELDYTAAQAKAWVWENYCEEAIEGTAQEKYIDDIWKQKQAKLKRKKK